MYEHFKPVEPVFVDREEYLEWMTTALSRCQDQSVLLHLRGIGGIGKTALIEHWRRTIDHAIILDCEQVTDFYDRLDVLARGAVRAGIRLQRFDVLWSIRLRFVQGIQAAKEPGRSWAFDVLKVLPFIGSMVNISKAIRTVGMKLSPLLKRRVGKVAAWLRDRLGKNYVETLLEILWRDPHRAEVLFLDALLEDVKGRKRHTQPVLVLLDHYEQVDTERHRWHYKDRKICEAELWWVFLSSLTNAVSITASRRPLPESLGLEVSVEEKELTELDTTSCRDLLAQRGVESEELQTQIISTTGGNPFALHAICDLRDLGDLSIDEVKSLRADTLEQVRLKIWRRLFSQAEGLHEIIDRAGLLPYFTRKTLTLLVPHLKTDQWDRLTHLSFVRDRGDGTWDLHSLAWELVLAELGDRLPKLALETAMRLEEGAKETQDLTLLGLAFSVQALVDEPEAINKATVTALTLQSTSISAVLSLLDGVQFRTNAGQGRLHMLRGFALSRLYRWAEVEQDFQESLRVFRELALEDPDRYQLDLAWTLMGLAWVLSEQGRASEAEEFYQEAFQLLDELKRLGEISLLGSPDMILLLSCDLHHNYGVSLIYDYRIVEAQAAFRESVRLWRRYVEKSPEAIYSLVDALLLQGDASWFSGKTTETEEAFQEAAQILTKLENAADVQWFYYSARTRDLYAAYFMVTGRVQEAERMYQVAVEHQREHLKLIGEAPLLFSQRENFLGRYLLHLSVALRYCGKLTEAEAVLQEARTIFRRIQEKELRGRLINLVVTLSQCGILFRQMGRFEEAEAVYKEAVTLYRPIADQLSKAYILGAAFLYNNYGVLLRQINRLAEAEAALREALVLFKPLLVKDLGFVSSLKTAALNNLGVVLAEAGNLEEAENAFKEALRIRLDNAREVPSMYLWMLVPILNNLGVLCHRSDWLDEAVHFYREVLKHCGACASHESTIVQSYFVRALSNYARLLIVTGAPDETVTEVRNQLAAFGVTELPELEEWIEEELDNLYF
ncbi:MAG: tetratricopeptide repeat protein [Promethearchaeota archaeon]